MTLYRIRQPLTDWIGIRLHSEPHPNVRPLHVCVCNAAEGQYCIVLWEINDIPSFESTDYLSASLPVSLPAELSLFLLPDFSELLCTTCLCVCHTGCVSITHRTISNINIVMETILWRSHDALLQTYLYRGLLRKCHGNRIFVTSNQKEKYEIWQWFLTANTIQQRKNFS